MGQIMRPEPQRLAPQRRWWVRMLRRFAPDRFVVVPCKHDMVFVFEGWLWGPPVYYGIGRFAFSLATAHAEARNKAWRDDVVFVQGDDGGIVAALGLRQEEAE